MIDQTLSLSEPIGFHPLQGPLLKVGRAKEHFDVLRRESEEFMADDPVEWQTEYDDREDGLREYVVSASLEEDPPIELGLITGDVVQNLRAALDQLVWGISDREKRGRRTAFPIFLSESAYRDNAEPLIEGVTGEGREQIEKWQPFQWGERAADHPLAILRSLSNTDKHRTLLPVAVARRRESVAGYGEWKMEEFTSHRTVIDFDERRIMTFATSGEPPERSTVNAYLTFELTIEGRALVEIESIFYYVGTDVLGWFDRG